MLPSSLSQNWSLGREATLNVAQLTLEAHSLSGNPTWTEKWKRNSNLGYWNLIQFGVGYIPLLSKVAKKWIYSKWKLQIILSMENRHYMKAMCSYSILEDIGDVNR